MCFLIVKSLWWWCCAFSTRLTLLWCNIHIISLLCSCSLCSSERAVEWRRRPSRSTSAWWTRSRNSLRRWMPSRWSDGEAHTCANTHSSLAHRTWQGMVHSVYPAFILLSAHKFNSLSQRDFLLLYFLTKSSCIYSEECNLLISEVWYDDQFLLLHSWPECPIQSLVWCVHWSTKFTL